MKILGISTRGENAADPWRPQRVAHAKASRPLWILRQLTAEGRLKKWLDDQAGNLLEPLVPRVS